MVDINVGRTATWLRAMGYDTILPKAEDDNELVRIALLEGRVLVTRDAGFQRRRSARLRQMGVVQITGDDLRGQLRQLVRELKLDVESGFSRCVRCNEVLTSVEKRGVLGRVPPYVFQRQCKFMECPVCLRLYWRGTHWSHMAEELKQICEEAG